MRVLAAAALAATVLIVTGCGGGSVGRSGTGASPAVVVMARAPDSLDPAVGDTPQALEADWLVYTPLLTYAHAGGRPGTQLVPGLAQYLPSISDGGRVYAFSLIKGLRYSDGHAVRASDFALAVERAIRLWPEAGRLVTSRIAGARAFAAGHAKAISGISADDATGGITIRLTAPYGAFEDVLALPALAPVPSGTPLGAQQAPPAGAGPYTITRVVPGRSFSLARTPGWARQGVQNVPAGHLDIDVRITGDAARNARSVLENTADVFDSSDQIPASLLSQVARQASGRYARRTADATDLVFMNVTRRPFSSQLAREAVRAALDPTALSRLGSGPLVQGCYVLPPTSFGHPHAPCPQGNAAGQADLSLARTLVRRSGMAGVRVVVSSAAGLPLQPWAAAYTSMLNQIGFNAHLRRPAGMRDPQTGFRLLAPAVPNPTYFYDELGGDAGDGSVEDPYLTNTLRVLAAIPGSTVSGVGGFWQRLESYVASRAYVAVVGYPTFPQFVSDRIDAKAIVFSPVAGVDWSSLRFR